jgi:hypothetical protein
MALTTDMSDLIKAIQEQTVAIENLSVLLQADLEEIKQLLTLTPIYPMRYYLGQENFGGQMQGVVYGKNTNLLKKKAKPRPPFVPKGQSVACVRCGYAWIPQSRTPQKCPTCRSPWWYPARWRWQKNDDSGKET